VPGRRTTWSDARRGLGYDPAMIDIRSIEPDELRAWIETMHAVYFMRTSVDEEVLYRRERIDYARAFAAVDEGRIVATFRSFGSDLTVPGGGRVPADAVTNVGVMPTHRRRGVLTGMMSRDLRAAADRGDVVSMLFASEGPIYGRYGYGVATEHAQVLLRRANVRWRELPEGDVEVVSWTRLREMAPAIYDRFRAAQPGSMGVDPKRWDSMFGIGPTPFGPRPGDQAAVCRDASGEPQGWLRYRGEETWTETRPAGTLSVLDLIAATPEAYARLWRFAAEIDLIAEIRAEGRPIAELLSWLLADRRAVHQTARHDGLWVRVLDVRAALSARRYPVAGELVIEVVDEAGFANGRFRLEGGPDGANCLPTHVEPDLVMTVEALGAAYLGGTKLSLLAPAGLLEERRPGSLGLADVLFGWPVVPWCCTEF